MRRSPLKIRALISACAASDVSTRRFGLPPISTASPFDDVLLNTGGRKPWAKLSFKCQFGMKFQTTVPANVGVERVADACRARPARPGDEHRRRRSASCSDATADRRTRRARCDPRGTRTSAGSRRPARAPSSSGRTCAGTESAAASDRRATGSRTACRSPGSTVGVVGLPLVERLGAVQHARACGRARRRRRSTRRRDSWSGRR